MKTNLDDIPNLVRFVVKEGCSSIRLLSLSPTGRALETYNELKLDQKDATKLNKFLTDLSEQENIEVEGGFCTRLSHPNLSILRGHAGCYAAINRVHIDAFGNVFPCTASSGRPIFSAGNITNVDESISTIWASSPYFQLLRYYQTNPPKRCERCTRYETCMTGCRVVVYHEYGDISVSNPSCEGPYH